MTNTMKVDFWQKLLLLTCVFSVIIFLILYFTLQKLSLTVEIIWTILIWTPILWFGLFFSFYRKEVLRLLEQDIKLTTYNKYKILLKEYYNKTQIVLPFLLFFWIISFIIYYSFGKDNVFSQLALSLFLSSIISLFLLNYFHYCKLTKMY